MGMCFRVFIGYAQVKNMRVEYDALIGDIEIVDMIMLPGIDHMFFIRGKGLAQVHIVGITAEAIAVIGRDFDRAFLHFFEDAGIGKYHSVSSF